MLDDHDFYPVTSLLKINEALESGSFNYKLRYRYNELIINSIHEIVDFNVRENNDEEVEDNIFELNSDKDLILDVITDLFKTIGNYVDIDLNKDKSLIEEFLNRITYYLDRKVYIYKKEDFEIQLHDSGDSQTFINYPKKQEVIKQRHNFFYNRIVFMGVDIWKDIKNSHLYFRIRPYENKQKTDKTKFANYLTQLLDKNINIYDSTDNVKDNDFDYLVASFLPFVKMEVFDTSTNIEFPSISNNMFYKNKFQYTGYLQKRFQRPLPFSDRKNSIIYQFLNRLFQTSEQFSYVIYWLSHYFQNLVSSKMALVLIGDSETTNTLIYDIIKPIFSLRGEYFSSINDNTLKSLTNDSILRDKVFYHINDLSSSNLKSTRTSQLVLEILKVKYNSAPDAWENNESYINGELIVTSSKNSPYPFLKDSYSRCTVLQVRSLSTILEELDIDHASFNDEVMKDLDNFSNILASEYLNPIYHNIYDWDEKNVLQFMKNGILKTPDLDNKIDEFIISIQSLNLDNFNYIKDSKELYEEFEYNFENKMIAQPLLSTYFNLLFKEIIFNDNASFIEILKEKAKMFKQAPLDKTKYNGKKRYKIF